MIKSKILVLYLALGSSGSLTSAGFAQAPPEPRIAIAATRASSQPAPKFSFILFWKENDANTQQVAEVLKSSVAKRAQRCEWTSVNVNDGASRPIVERYQVGRMPMPTVLCVAPNGAVTGAFVRKLNEEAVDGALVSPLGADIVKSLQDKKIVVVQVKQAADSPMPFGAGEFVADPEFRERTITVSFIAGDPAESRLLRDLEINAANVSGSMVIVMAPPGVLVGKFPAAVTKDQIAAALHAAGKCCNDPNCKHNQQGQQK